MPLRFYARTRARVFLAVVLLILAGSTLYSKAEMDTGKPEPVRAIQARSPEPVYHVEAGVRGDIFPAFANFLSFQPASERDSGTVSVTVTNPTDSLISEHIAVNVEGWSDREIQVIEIGAGQVRTVQFAPTFLPRFYRNREITAATAKVDVSDLGGHPVFSTTIPVRLRSADDIYWGSKFEYAPFIASWVTPHDPRVEGVLSLAKEFMPGRRLPGYETWRAPGAEEKTTFEEVRAIYNALKRKGVSYVKSSGTLGARANADLTERVRMPFESVGQVSANCIDGAVLYAALFENLGMDPVIVLVPGHAYVGVRLAPDSKQFLYIETALTGRAPFETAVRSANAGLARYTESQVIRIPIEDARDQGIYPMPAFPGDSENALDGTTSRASNGVASNPATEPTSVQK